MCCFFMLLFFLTEFIFMFASRECKLVIQVRELIVNEYCAPFTIDEETHTVDTIIIVLRHEEQIADALGVLGNHRQRGQQVTILHN